MAIPRKEIRINFRLTEEEHSELVEKATKEGLVVSKYIRNILRNEKKLFTLDKNQLKMLQDEFANMVRVGSNIHQISRKLNYRYRDNEKGEQDYYLISEKEIATLKNELAETNKGILEINKKISYLCKVHKVN